MRILIVDDSQTLRLILRKDLESMGLAPGDVLEAVDGVEALLALQREKLEIDLILSDWNMPRMDGITFLKQVRALNPLREIPVIMVTTLSEKANVVEALKNGARDYILKPFDSALLKEKIQKIQAPLQARRHEETTALLRMIAESAPGQENLPFFSRLPKDLAQDLIAFAQVSAIEPGVTFLKPGETVDHLMIVAEGEVEILDVGTEARLETRRSGECVGEVAFMASVPSRLAARSKTPVVLNRIPRIQLGNMVRRHPKLSFYLSNLIARRAGPAAPRPAKDEEGLSGRLSTLSFADVIQVFHANQQTGVLELRAGIQRGGIYFELGQVRHAWTNDRTGQQAFFSLMQWATANFVFKPGPQGDAATITIPTMSLLMEGSRHLDELRRGGARPS